MKMSDIGFLKTEPNRTDFKMQKPKKTRFLQFSFHKNNFGWTNSAWQYAISSIIPQRHMPYIKDGDDKKANQ